MLNYVFDCFIHVIAQIGFGKDYHPSIDRLNYERNNGHSNPQLHF